MSYNNAPLQKIYLLMPPNSRRARRHPHFIITTSLSAVGRLPPVENSLQSSPYIVRLDCRLLAISYILLNVNIFRSKVCVNF